MEQEAEDGAEHGMDPGGDLTVEVRGRVGVITLTRPAVLNAVNDRIVRVMTASLAAWAEDPAVDLVLVQSDSERAFSAGGDLAAMYHLGKAGTYAPSGQFWREEYRLNAMIARYPKPYVAIMDGIVMGGGVGLSAHGSHRVVTDQSMVAMPECAIGLVPDVGGSHLLNRAPGQLGLYLGLTGTRMTGADAIHAGFADYYVPRSQLAELKAQVIATADPAVIAAIAQTPPPSSLAALQPLIDPVFDAPSVAVIQQRLATIPQDWAQRAQDALAKASPISLLMTFDVVRAAGSLEEGLRHEYRFVSRVLELGDFVEGIRAVIIDKDRNPHWRYSTLEAVPADLLDRFRSPADGGDPQF